MAGFDLSRRVWIEAESRRIGKRRCQPVLANLRASPIVEIAASFAARHSYLLRDYAWLGDDRESFAELGTLREDAQKDPAAQWQAWALAAELPQLFEALMRQTLTRSARSPNTDIWPENWACDVQVACDDLSDAGIVALAAASRRSDQRRNRAPRRWSPSTSATGPASRPAPRPSCHLEQAHVEASICPSPPAPTTPRMATLRLVLFSSGRGAWR